MRDLAWNFTLSRWSIDIKYYIDLSGVIFFHTIFNKIVFIVVLSSLINDSNLILIDCLRNDFVASEQSNDSFEFVVVFKTNVTSVATVNVDLQLHTLHN